MKVNEGTIRFDFNSELSMKELARQLVSIGNDQHYANITIMNMFHEQGRRRYAEGAISIDHINERTDTSQLAIDNINSEYLFKNIMKSISNITKVDTKYALLIHFMGLGLQYTFRDHFALSTNPGDLSESYSDTAKVELIDLNARCNGIINTYYSNTDRDIGLEFDVFFNRVKEDISSAGYEKMQNYDRTYFVLGESSNIKKLFYEDRVDDDHWYDFLDALKTLRYNYTTLINPKDQSLLEYFNMTPARYKTGKLDGLNILIKSYGKTLSRKIAG